MSVFQQIWKWFRYRVCKLPENRNSGGDLIRKYEPQVRSNVTKVIDRLYQEADHNSRVIVWYADTLISQIIAPLPDGIEAIVKALTLNEVASWLSEVIEKKLGRDAAIEYIMNKLLELP